MNEVSLFEIQKKKTRIYYQSIEIEINLNGNYC